MFKNKLDKNPKYFTTSFYTVLVVIISAIIIKILFNWDSFSNGVSSVLKILSPFLIGIFIAYLLYPVVMLFKNKLLLGLMHFKTPTFALIIGILFTYVIVLGGLAILLIFVIPQIIESISDVIFKAQHNYALIPEYIDKLEEKYTSFDFEYINEMISSSVPSMIDSIKNFVTNVIPVIFSTSVTVIKWIFNILVAIIVSIYFIVDRDRLLRGFKRIIYALFKKEKAAAFLSTGKECNMIFGNFLYGKIVDSIIIGIICFVSMIILNLPFALLVSIIVGITNLIPYFGPFIGAVPSALIILMYGWKEALIFLLLILIIQQFDGWILGPKILGDSTGLRPLWIIFAIIIGGYIAGPIGMFLGVPSVAVIAYLVNKKTDAVLRKNELCYMVDDQPSKTIERFNFFNSMNPKKKKKD